MRVDEEIKVIGNFWSPSNPDDKKSGTLTIKDGGKSELELLGDLGNSSDLLHCPERIVGYVESYGPVTL